MSWPILLGALLVAGTASPPEPECEPVLGVPLRPGRWGLVRLSVTNSSGESCRPALAQAYPRARQAVAAAGPLGAGRQGEYRLPFRPLSADVPLVAELGGYRVEFPGRVRASGLPAVTVVGPPGTSPPPLPVESPGYAAPGTLPALAAAYESADVLVFGAASGLDSLSPEQRRALAGWFSAGGRAVLDSPEALRGFAGVLLGRPGQQLPADRAGWLKLLGAGEADVRLWDGERPAVALFRRGFGMGLYADLSRASAGPAWAEASKAAYHGLFGARAPACAPAVWPALYHEPGGGDFPGLDRAAVGAGAALRWALGAALLVAAAGAAAWRRGRPRRLALAACGAALAAALAVALLVPAVRLRTLSLRIEEYAPDGGARVREYLHVEKAGGPADAEILCAPGALPAPILYAGAEAAGLAGELRPEGAGAPGDGAVLAGLAFREQSLWLGAGPLPADSRSAPPPGASRRRTLARLSGPEAVLAVADCLTDAGSACRAQAEFLARWLVREAASGPPEGPVTVCRMPEPELGAAMSAGGAGVRGARLHPLGVFYGGAR